MQNNLNAAPPETVEKSTPEKLNNAHTEPISDAFAPLLLCGICMLLGLLALIIDKFVFPFSSELLAPVLCQILILILILMNRILILIGIIPIFHLRQMIFY